MIPIMRPLMPKAENILPYLEKIDDSRWYSNHGPLVEVLEDSLAKIFDANTIVTSSCTSGLTAALLSMNQRRGTYVLTPSFTFVASLCAIDSAGLNPLFCDVDEKTWTLDPEYVKEVLKRTPYNVRCVLAVSPFGVPVEITQWEKFSKETGLRVVIDAAGGFDSVKKTSDIPIVISTHCTKNFGTGEGGFVLCKDKKRTDSIRNIINYGISPDREVNVFGINGKMSEYHAAVGLASLDEWKETRQAWLRRKNYYIDIFDGVSLPCPLHGRDWTSHVFCIRLPKSVKSLPGKLKDKGIMTRQIWGTGGHNYKAYQPFPKTSMEVTEAISDSVLFLPFAVDMKKEDMNYVKQAIVELM